MRQLTGVHIPRAMGHDALKAVLLGEKPKLLNYATGRAVVDGTGDMKNFGHDYKYSRYLRDTQYCFNK